MENKFHVIYKSGATVYDKKNISTLIRRVREAQEPVVLIWLGTCEITQKKGKHIKSLDYPYQNIEFILTEYRKLKLRIKHANPQAVIPRSRNNFKMQ